ncbi:somatostatin-2-like [Syngnathus acus]|uniref:somatostatin-2-like n=1 Tax=Syngnathus acus TaxID=161584 RepID=UPI001885C9DF|nr:somatostatin-2-like [Syngnathus acus]
MRPHERSLLAFVMCLLACGPAASSQPEARPDGDGDRELQLELELELRRHRMAQQAAHGAGDLPQEWSERVAEELLERMSPPRAESRRTPDLFSARMPAERSVEPANNLPPRERKAGCKNFYWKGFTSC